MTLLVFPTLDGIEYGNTKRPDFKTTVFESLSGRESRVSFRAFPKYTFKIAVANLIQHHDEKQLDALMGFMLQLYGQSQAFLFADPNDNSVADEIIGTGNGSNKDFQLARTYGGFTEPVENLNGNPQVFVDNVEQVLTTDYTVSASGVVSFVSAPANNAVISWTGNYYYRCRFTADGYDFLQNDSIWHECDDIEFVGSVRTVV